jgi:spermidine synthase
MKDTEFLGSAERSIGMLYLSRHQRPDVPDDWVYDVHIDGALLMSSDSPLSERMLATRAIEAHPGEQLRVLVGGLGLGYTAQAALDSPRASLVRVVDAMDFVIGWLQEGLLPLSASLTTDERVQLVQGDVYADLLGPPSETWDVILVDVDHAPDMPLDPASLVFYTPEGQQRVGEHLAPGGILAVWSAHDNDDFAAVLDQVYVEAWREHIEWNATRYDEDERPLHNVLFFGRKP